MAWTGDRRLYISVEWCRAKAGSRPRTECPLRPRSGLPAAHLHRATLLEHPESLLLGALNGLFEANSSGSLGFKAEVGLSRQLQTQRQA